MSQNLELNKSNSRYRSLIIFITLFVLIIVSILSVNFYVSTRIADDANEINLSGRQRMLSQRTAKSIQGLINAQASNANVSAQMAELKNTFDLFDSTLNAFTNGGETIGTDGKPIAIKKANTVAATQAITAANQIWSEYRNVVKSLVDSDIDALEKVAEAVDYANLNNNSILTIMDQLTTALTDKQYAGVYVNLSGRQRMLSQRISKSLYELINAQANNSDFEPILQSLSSDQNAFNQTLSILTQGGSIQSGSSINEISAIDDFELVEIINKGQSVWQPLNNLISNVLNADTTSLLNLANANQLAQKNNVNLLTLMNDLTTTLDQDATERASILRYVQVFGIILATLMFAVIVLFFLKQLRKSDKELGQAKEETDRILETVNDGLFLMDTEHAIGSQHSNSLKKVINLEQPTGKNFLNVLRKIVPEKTLETAKDYLDLLYGDTVHEDLVTDLNPLDNVEVYFGGEELEKDVGHLGFQFKRVLQNDKVSHLLVQVEDITDKVRLEKELAQSKEKAQAQFDLMLQVLHVNPDMLKNFLAETENSLRDINGILQEKTRTEQGNRKKLESISRIMHRIKGDASGLELEGFEQKAHEFENLIQELKDKDELTGKEFLPMAISLDEFMGQIESLRSLIIKLTELQVSVVESEIDDNAVSKSLGGQLSNILTNLSNSVANKQKKKVLLNVFNEHLVPTEYTRSIQDILTQLVRNSVVHGIESPQQRAFNRKTDEGLINIKFSKDRKDNSLLIEYTDDGKGLITNEILFSAVKKGLVSEEQSKLLTKKQIMSLIFKPGFSTKASSDIDAGRGVGMDVVKDLVKNLGGKVGINSIDHKFFKLLIKLPEMNNSTQIMEAQ